MAWLREAQTGEAIGVLAHRDVPGRIDLIWGDEKGGLAHIVHDHPGVVERLPELLAGMHAFTRSSNRIRLTDGTYFAIVRLERDGLKKTWLLSAFGPEDRRGGGRTGSPSGFTGPAQSPGPTAAPNISQGHGAVKGRAARGPRAKDPDFYSLLEFLASEGGIRSDDPLIADLRASIGADNKFVPGFGNLIRKPRELSTAAHMGGGRAPMFLDAARAAAVVGGYLHDQGNVSGRLAQTTVSTLLEAIDNELRGKRVYRYERAPRPSRAEIAEMREEHLYRLEGDFAAALEEQGIDRDSVPAATRARVLEIMERERVSDPLVAYEQAVMEESHYGGQAGEGGRTQEFIPGWDVPDDAGAAPGLGGAAQATGPDAARAAAREPRPADRGADWRALADRRPAYDDPVAVAESKEAAATPEPASIDPAKAPSAAEQAARDADALYADMREHLSDEERAQFDEALAALDREHQERGEIIKQGAACLAAAARHFLLNK